MHDNNNFQDSIDRTRANHEIYKINSESRRNKIVFAKRVPLFFKIFLCVIIIAILLFLSYFFLVHPVNKLNWRMDRANNCQMLITLKNGSYENTVRMSFEDNYVCVHGGYWNRYYEIEGGELYEYKKHPSDKREPVLVLQELYGDGFDKSEALLEKDNYERVRGKWFSWKIKDNVDTGNFSNVQLRQHFGQFIITGDVQIDKIVYKVEIVISKIGSTKVDLP